MEIKKRRKAKRILFLTNDSSEYIFGNRELEEVEKLNGSLDVLNELELQKKKKAHKLTKEEFEFDIEEM